VVKVCCRSAAVLHHPNTPFPQEVERERAAEERRALEKENNWHHDSPSCLATILQRVSAS